MLSCCDTSLSLKNSVGAGVGDRRASHSGDRLRLPILNKLGLELSLGLLFLGELNYRQKQLNRVPAANRVLGTVEVACEVVETLRLNQTHSLSV